MAHKKNKELTLMGKAASEFAGKELAPDREENDRFPFGPFFSKTLDHAFDLDFFHITLPQQMGGIGRGVTALSVILDNICQEDSSLGGIIFTNALSQEIMTASGSEDLLAGITRDTKMISEYLIACQAFNNPVEIPPAVEAVENGGEYTLSGTLEYLVLGGMASHAVIPAVLKPSPRGMTYFLVNTSEPGFVKSDPVHSLGLHACPAVDVTFQNVPARLLGEPGRGGAYFDQAVSRMNIPAAAMSAGIMKGSLKEALAYCKARSQGGRKIINWSEVRMILADMALKVKNAEMGISRASMAADDKEPDWEAGAAAVALHVQAMCCEVTTDGVQLLGGVGYMKDFGQEKRYRDAKQIQALMGISPLKKIRYLKTFMGIKD